MESVRTPTTRFLRSVLLMGGQEIDFPTIFSCLKSNVIYDMMDNPRTDINRMKGKQTAAAAVYSSLVAVYSSSSHVFAAAPNELSSAGGVLLALCLCCF